MNWRKMEEQFYPYQKIISEIIYDFWSISNEKKVRKRVIFTALSNRQIYNVALVDVMDDNTISDISETKNKDMSVVLATVIQIIDSFLHENPDKYVLFKGSDSRRQRLYRVVVSRELTKIQGKFVVLGGFDEAFPEPFQPNQEYDYFIISKIQ